MRRIRVIFRGRVQGVGFRATCAHAARPYAVTGWVRNEPDASVTLEAQGPPADVEALLDAVAERMGANIDHADPIEIPPLPGETTFEIRR